MTDPHKFSRVEDPAEKMAELEHELDVEDGIVPADEDISKYAPREMQASADSSSGEEEQKEEDKSEHDQKAGIKPESTPEPEASTAVEEKESPLAGQEGEESPPKASEADNGKEKKDQKEAEKEAPRQAEENGEDSESANSGSSWLLNISIIACVLLIGWLGYMHYGLMQKMPKDPISLLKEEKEMIFETFKQREIEHFEVQKRALKNKEFMIRKQRSISLEKAADEKEKQIASLEREIMGLRVQARTEFARYKDYTRKNVRDLHFDSMTTVKTKKTYFDVTIRSVNDKSISIVHAGGATTLEPSDLSDALQARLAFGDPLGLADMEKDQEADVEMKKNIGKYRSHIEGVNTVTPGDKKPARTINNEALLKEDFEPPSKSPTIETKPSRDSSINDGWVPPEAPMPL